MIVGIRSHLRCFLGMGVWEGGTYNRTAQHSAAADSSIQYESMLNGGRCWKAKEEEERKGGGVPVHFFLCNYLRG